MTKDSTVLPLDAYGGAYSARHAATLDHGTSHVSVVDKHGNAVSLTTTINTYFGSKAPGKRPLSSMSPSFVLSRDGGASGGPRIITSTAQVILNYIGKGMQLLQAVVQPRIHTQLLPDM
eukprot:gene37006-49933_t